MSENKKLRAVTYLSPDIPIDVFELFVQYIEEVTGNDSYLIYESRWKGPPEGRTDPFTADDVDIAFMESTDYLRLVGEQNKHIELCDAGAIHVHTKNQARPVYYSELIINARNKMKYKEIIDLRGHTLAYSSDKSISSSVAVLDALKKLGFDASFFGSNFQTGSHIASIRSVLDSRVDVAAVNSNALSGFLRTYPNFKEDITVISSIGPLPTYPIVFNSKLSEKLKSQITKGLLDMSQNLKWSKRLAEVGIAGFVPIDGTLYSTESDLRAAVSSLSMTSAYY